MAAFSAGTPPLPHLPDTHDATHMQITHARGHEREEQGEQGGCARGEQSASIWRATQCGENAPERHSGRDANVLTPGATPPRAAGAAIPRCRTVPRQRAAAGEHQRQRRGAVWSSGNRSVSPGGEGEGGKGRGGKAGDGTNRWCVAARCSYPTRVPSYVASVTNAR